MRKLALVSFLALSMIACGEDDISPEDRIRAMISDMEQAVESNSLKSAAGLLHADYSDDWHPDRRAAVRSLFGYLRRHSSVHLLTVIRDVTVAADAQSAAAAVYVAMSGVPVESVETLVALNADIYRFDIEMLFVDDAWRIAKARWKRAELGSLGN